MASTNNMYRYLALVLSLLLVVSVAESRKVPLGESSSSCDEVHGAQPGDTCDVVAKEFNLSPESFLAINPNINCAAIFVGQWLCVAGSA